VNHAGNRDMQIHKAEVTAAEVVILKHIHGTDSIVNVEKTREDRREHPKECARLARVYGKKVFEALFPGISPRLPVTLSDIGLDERGMSASTAEDEEEGGAPLAEPTDEQKATAARVAAKMAAKPQPAAAALT
jgi:hypothetical protein